MSSSLPASSDCSRVFALLDDCHATAATPTSRLYTGFVREHRCDNPAMLDTVWAAADRDLRAGLHAVVLADYEWGARLIRAGHEDLGPEQGGSLRLLMFKSLQLMGAEEIETWLQVRERQPGGGAEGADGPGPAPAGVLDIRSSVDETGFCDAIARIRAAIGEGETYQVNYTYRLDFRSFGSPLSLYRRLRARQPVAYGALLALPAHACGPDWVLSCSPELFLRNCNGSLWAKPMKGTAPRAREPEGDGEIARLLASDNKNRAENLMIVDLLRNDLGRVARTGSVRVPALFSVETYPTVFQMTSTIEAALPDEVGFPALLRALFPCGSITGAPKHRTMQLIARLENTPRGLYTGSIGWIDAPRQEGVACGDFCLSVAIRTLTLQARTDSAGFDGRMGVGAGIVIDSLAGDEFEECALKARFLTGLDPGFCLFETMHATRDAGIRHLDRHLSRLAKSAAALNFRWPGGALLDALERQCALLAPTGPARMRLTLHKDGYFDIGFAPLEPLPAGPVGVLLAAAPMQDDYGLLRHKTTLRHRYDMGIRAAQARGGFDTLFFDQDGFVTEGGRTNVFVRIEGEWRTPPLGDQVLPGTMRAALLENRDWAVREAPVSLAELRRAERIVLTNALRGVLDARLLEETA